ncbi:MAG: hypothetical protein JKY93_01070 [Gammaproteobacteria bacterium]|nr:hypothetical protein [Gammaproteobacteria bacterium]
MSKKTANMPTDIHDRSIPALSLTKAHDIIILADGKSAATELNKTSPVVNIEVSATVRFAFGAADVDVLDTDFQWTTMTSLGAIAVPTDATHIRFRGAENDTIHMIEMG